MRDGRALPALPHALTAGHTATILNVRVPRKRRRVQRIHPKLCQSLPVAFSDVVLVQELRQLAHANDDLLIDMLGLITADAEMRMRLKGDRRICLR